VRPSTRPGAGGGFDVFSSSGRRLNHADPFATEPDTGQVRSFLTMRKRSLDLLMSEQGLHADRQHEQDLYRLLHSSAPVARYAAITRTARSAFIDLHENLPAALQALRERAAGDRHCTILGVQDLDGPFLPATGHATITLQAPPHGDIPPQASAEESRGIPAGRQKPVIPQLEGGLPGRDARAEQAPHSHRLVPESAPAAAGPGRRGGSDSSAVAPERCGSRRHPGHRRERGRAAGRLRPLTLGAQRRDLHRPRLGASFTARWAHVRVPSEQPRPARGLRLVNLADLLVDPIMAVAALAFTLFALHRASGRGFRPGWRVPGRGAARARSRIQARVGGGRTGVGPPRSPASAHQGDSGAGPKSPVQASAGAPVTPVLREMNVVSADRGTPSRGNPRPDGVRPAPLLCPICHGELWPAPGPRCADPHPPAPEGGIHVDQWLARGGDC
jgi:hypothetical protein